MTKWIQFHCEKDESIYLYPITAVGRFAMVSVGSLACVEFTIGKDTYCTLGADRDLSNVYNCINEFLCETDTVIYTFKSAVKRGRAKDVYGN